MKLRHVLLVAAASLFVPGKIFADGGNVVASSTAVYVPDTSHQNDPLPDGVLDWDATSKATDVAANEQQAHFAFNFTNVSGSNVVVLYVRPSCGCTTVKLPQLPWTILPGKGGSIDLTVNIEDRSGTLFKTVTVTTDKGNITLMMRINILPPATPELSEADRLRDISVAKVDRQAVFRGDCAVCHVNNGANKYGKPLYDADCAICHEGVHRANVVPDLYNLKTLTSEEFWRNWIAHGKTNSLMPAFSKADGGPLTDMQIASLAAYLNVAIPPHALPMTK